MIIFIFFMNIILSEAVAIEPNEILKNKELEAQARAIGKELDAWFVKTKIFRIQMLI